MEISAPKDIDEELRVINIKGAGRNIGYSREFL